MGFYYCIEEFFFKVYGDGLFCVIKVIDDCYIIFCWSLLYYSV